MQTQAEAVGIDAVVEESHRALSSFVEGDPNPMKALMSHGDDVTLANPFGPPRRGWPEVEKAMEQAAADRHGGRAVAFERVSAGATPELAYVVELERYEARVGEVETTSEFSLRCTTVLRREADGWEIVHRHADPITTPRSAESLLGASAHEHGGS